MTSSPSSAVEPVAWQRCRFLSDATICLLYTSSPGSLIDGIAMRLDSQGVTLTLYERHPPDVWPDGAVGAVSTALSVHAVLCTLPRDIKQSALIRDGATRTAEAASDVMVEAALGRRAGAASAKSCAPPASTCPLVSPRQSRRGF